MLRNLLGHLGYLLVDIRSNSHLDSYLSYGLVDICATARFLLIFDMG